MGRALIVPGVDFSETGLGTVTLKGNVPLSGISIDGPMSVVKEARFTVSYYPPNTTTQRGVTWSIISGGSYAAIDSNTGVLTALSGASASSVTVKATSIYDQNIYATKTISVTYVGVVEYVASKGGEGIPYINTGIGPASTYKFDMTFMLEDATNQDIFGSRISASSQILRFFAEPTVGKFRAHKRVSSGTSDKQYDLNHTVVTGKKYRIVFSYTSSNALHLYEVTDNGDVLLAEGGNMSPSVSSSVPIFLGALNNNGTPVASRTGKLRIYKFRIFTGSGESASDDVLVLTPGYDELNARPCLVDESTGTLYPYQSTGSATLYYKTETGTEQSISIIS